MLAAFQKIGEHTRGRLELLTSIYEAGHDTLFYSHNIAIDCVDDSKSILERQVTDYNLF